MFSRKKGFQIKFSVKPPAELMVNLVSLVYGRTSIFSDIQNGPVAVYIRSIGEIQNQIVVLGTFGKKTCNVDISRHHFFTYFEMNSREYFQRQIQLKFIRTFYPCGHP